jgi:hypothetical protein
MDASIEGRKTLVNTRISGINCGKNTSGYSPVEGSREEV